MKPDFYRRCRRAIRKADRFRMKGNVRKDFIRAARRKVAKALAAVLVLLALPLLTGCALPLSAKNGQPSIPDTNERITKALLDGSLAVVTRVGLAHGCPVEVKGKTVILTSAHVVDPRPLDASAPAFPICWSDGVGNEGHAALIWIDPYRDLAVLGLRSGTPGSVFALTADRPAVGTQTWTLGYDFSSRKAALAPRTVRAEVVRTVAGHAVLDRSADEGSSGGCVLDADGHALAINSWGVSVGYKEGERVSVVPGLWGNWLSVAEEK